MGAYCVEQLEEKVGHLPHVGEVRGVGLHIGVELVKDKESKEPLGRETGVVSKIIEYAYEHGVYLLGGDNQLRIGPPLVVTKEEIDRVVEVVRGGIAEVTG